MVSITIELFKEDGQMYITFLIGNGFDLNLGLKTRYVDFYDYYKEYASKESVILHWMQEDDDKGYWSDLEVALGNKVKSIDNGSVKDFFDAHEELDSLLLEYLEIEENKYNVEVLGKEILTEMIRSLTTISKELTPEEQQSFENTYKASINEEIQYWFITFNYTGVLDSMIEKMIKENIDLGSHSGSSGQKLKHSIGGVHHVHGTMTEGIVLGVNDESQINNEFLVKNNMFKDIFLKGRINNQMGQRRTERAEAIIDKSQFICIFGMSLGITDKRWWEKIVNWMLADSNRKLIIYARSEGNVLKRRIPTRIILDRERVRRDLWEKGKGGRGIDTYERIKPRIIVIFNSKIFSFPKVDSP